ncbi:alpha-ketoacid dehydrogenase subunit alpha/beta [Devosia sp. A449]
MATTTNSFQIDVFRRAAFIRAFEAKAMDLSAAKPPVINGSVHFCAGQEVVPVATIAALRDDDQIICTYRGHGWAIASDLDPTSLMAELCHREGGVNGGRGGSALIAAPHTRFVGENSIVGAGTTIACGVAIANTLRDTGRVVIVTIGDGAMNQGSVHEAFAFAAARKLPVIFVVENNGWSELTATSDMFAIDRLSMRARGYGMPGATISGTDPVAVRDSIAAAAEHARNGNGPSLLEFKVPRLWGHYNRDIQHYRSKSDREAAEANDPLLTMRPGLLEQGFTDADLDKVVAEEASRVEAIVERVVALPPANAAQAADHVVSTIPEVQVNEVERQTLSGIEAVNLALKTELQNDQDVIFFGEDVGKAGGIFGAARNLQREFGEHRVFDTPIAENAILGSAVGAAISGLRPVVEIMWADFIFVALDQLVNQAANVRYLSQGKTSAPLTVRTQQGATPGSCPQHAQSIEAILAHIPGLKVAVTSNANDNYAVLRAAIRDNDPCVVIEAREGYQTKSEVIITDEAEAVGKAKLKREGKDVTIVSWGMMVNKALQAAEQLATEGIEATVLDLRWLSPLDETALRAAVDASNGNVIVAHEATRTGGFGAEIVARVLEYRSADGRPINIRRVATPDVRIPASAELQQALIPSPDDLVDEVRSLLKRSK